MSLTSAIFTFISTLATDIKTINSKAIKANKTPIQSREYSFLLPSFTDLPQYFGMSPLTISGDTSLCACQIGNPISEIKRIKFQTDTNSGVSVWNGIKNCRIGRTIFSTGFKTIYRFAFDDGADFNIGTSFFIGLSDETQDIRDWDLDTKTNKIGFGFKPNDTHFKFYCAGTVLNTITLTDLGAIANKNVYELAIAHSGRENLVRIKVSNLTTDIHVFLNFNLTAANKAPDENILLTPFSMFRKSVDNSFASVDLMFFSLEKLAAQNNVAFPNAENQNDLNLTEAISGINDLNLI